MSAWEYSQPPATLVETLGKELQVSGAIAELVARLGFIDVEEVRRFLNPRLSDVACPFEIPNLRKAANRICQAIDDGQRIVICGDYDVDGVTSTTLLVDILQRFGNFPKFIVPLRLDEGYGLSRRAAERAMDCGEAADLFIALDCGTNSFEEAEYILSQGCDLVIVDHHQSKQSLPEEVVLVNPHVHGDEGNEALRFCTVGLVFKLAYGIVKLRREQKDQRAFDIVLREYLDLVSMGTIADLVPLIHENRTLTRIGLNALGKTKRMGLKSLMSVAGMNASHGVKPVDISFKIAPRINASGRLADAALAVELLLSDDASYSMELSLKLDSFNRERQEIEKKIAQEAMAQVEAGQSNNSGLVVYGDDWHPGVVGIVASRVSRAYGRPCIVLGREGKLAKGSGRSIDGVNLVDVLNNFSDEMEAWGGHPMAVGVSIDKEKVERLRQHFDQGVKAFMESHVWEKTIEISTFLKLEDINSDLMDEIDLLQPFGQANREPIFGSKQVVFRQRPKVFKDVHFRFALEDSKGRLIQGVAWKMADRIPDLNTPVDIAYRLAWNSFGRQKVLQIDLVEWKAS